MHLLHRMNVMLDFIWTLPVQLRETWNKWTLQKHLVHGRIRTPETARPPDYKSTVLPLGQISNVTSEWIKLNVSIKVARKWTPTEFDDTLCIDNNLRPLDHDTNKIVPRGLYPWQRGPHFPQK